MRTKYYIAKNMSGAPIEARTGASVKFYRFTGKKVCCILICTDFKVALALV